jgi:hypothetical protein
MYKSIINSFNEVLTKKLSFFELLLNISFVLIIGLIIFIFYWHNINWKIAKLNRCKINLNSEGSIYNLYASYDQTKLYKVRYDNSTKHNVSIDCVCPTGNIPNTFKVPAYNAETNKIKIHSRFDKLTVLTSQICFVLDKIKLELTSGLAKRKVNAT